MTSQPSQSSKLKVTGCFQQVLPFGRDERHSRISVFRCSDCTCERACNISRSSNISHNKMLEHSDIESGQEEERRLPLHHSTKIPNWTGYTSTGSPSQLQRKLLTSAPQSLSGLLPIPDLLLMDSRNDKKEVKLHALTNFKNGRKPSQRRLTRTMSNSTTNQIPNALYVAAWFLLATLLFGIYYHYIHSKHNTLQPFAMKFPSASRRNSIRYSYAP